MTPRPTPIGDLDWQRVPSPCFVVDLRLVGGNARALAQVREATGCRVLLALKAFSMWSAFGAIAPHLDGCAASGPFEARLAREKFVPAAAPGARPEVHAYAPAFSARDLAETLPAADHIVFNSPSEVARHLPAVQACAGATGRRIEVGLRINPGYSEVAVPAYDPCAPASRLGTPRAALGSHLPDGVRGLHFHALCEQGADVFARVLARVEADFGHWFGDIHWLNCGGGHWITKPGYDVALLVATLRALRARHPHLDVYVEPGEAVVVDSGVLVATVLDVVPGDLPRAILDVSATCHMPDVLEMPYQPCIHGASAVPAVPGAAAAMAGGWTCRLGGPTCLAGDVLGDWQFPRPLAAGDRVVFADMAQYTMVKSTMFNGVRHPSLATWDGVRLDVVRRFDYADFRDRLS